jgi:hypothetical protein
MREIYLINTVGLSLKILRSFAMEVNHSQLLATILTSFFLSSTCLADTPSHVTFSNETNLSLNTMIAGLPGSGIDPSVSKTVSYSIVNWGCTYRSDPQNCPIEFFDKQTGNKVATVYINSLTATLNAEPIFYGEYASLYQVSGWDASPISHISIVYKNNAVSA